MHSIYVAWLKSCLILPNATGLLFSLIKFLTSNRIGTFSNFPWLNSILSTFFWPNLKILSRNNSVTAESIDSSVSSKIWPCITRCNRWQWHCSNFAAVKVRLESQPFWRLCPFLTIENYIFFLEKTPAQMKFHLWDCKLEVYVPVWISVLFDINWFGCSVAGFDDKLACKGLSL